MQTILFKTIDSVPFGKILLNFDWLDDYLVCQAAKLQISIRKNEERELKEMRRHPSDALDSLRNSYKKTEEERLNKLSSFMNENWEHPDIITFFSSMQEGKFSGIKLPQLPDLKEFERALKLVQTGSGLLKKKKKESEFDSLAEEIAGLNVEIQENSPSKFFMRDKKNIICDIRQVFIGNWEHLQSGCSTKCGYQGLELKECDAAQRKAYKRLQIKGYINHRSQYCACKP